MMVLMKLLSRASPKHRYDMTVVDYGGGGHRTRLKDQLINLCVLGCPLPPYIKDKGGRPTGEVLGRRGGGERVGGGTRFQPN